MSISQVIAQTFAGCGHLECCGHHPGNLHMIVFVCCGAAAGANGGMVGAFVGALIMAGAFGPVYLIGAYDRGARARRSGK